MDTITTTQPPFNLQNLNLPPPQPPPSIAELRHISAALSQFLRDYDDLHSHIGSVNAALDEKLSVHFKGNAVNNFDDFALTPLVVDDCGNDNSVKNVLEGSVVELNPRFSVSDFVLSDDDDVKGVVSARKRNECVLSDGSVLEGVVLEQKRSECVISDGSILEGVVSRNECVVDDDDDVRMHATSDNLVSDSERVVKDTLEVVSEGVKNYEQNDGVVDDDDDDDDVRMHASSDSFINDSDGIVNVVLGDVKGTESDEGAKNFVVNDVIEGVVVTDGKCQGSVSESEYESSKYVKKREESDCEQIVSDECEWGDGNVRMYQSVKKDEEIIDALVKMEESDCAEIIIDVSEAAVSEQNLNESEIIVTDFGDPRVSGRIFDSADSECEQGDDDVRMDESPNSLDGCKETGNESEETDDEGEKLDAAKNVEETNYDRAINELLEEVDAIQKNHSRTSSKCDNVRKPQSSSSLENSEETDYEDGEIEAPKNPEDDDYDRIVTELLEDIDVVPKPNRTASDSDQRYDKPQSPNYLKNHLDEIDVSVNPEDKNHEQTDVSMETDVSEKHEEMDILKNPAESDVSEKPEEIYTAKNPEETDVSKKPEEVDVPEKPEYVEILKNPKSADSELEKLCKSMSGRELKKYVVKHISNIDKLRTELSKALKLAKNPAKLVLDSIGTYFVQSGKTYNRGSYHYIKDGSRASVLILECFVMISGDGIEISREDETSAAKAANLWKSRMINEGGLQYTEEADARGLLLLISGFGISDRLFSTVDILDLMRASNAKGISNILRRSIALMLKIPEVIDMMVMNKLEVGAADIAYTFGLEYKCHPLTILTKFLRSIIDEIESGSPVPKIEAMKQQLDGLVSVKECLESNNIDPNVLSEFKIDEKIHHLKLQVQKRKAMDIESSSNSNHQEAKRTCLSHKTMLRGISSYNQSMQPGYSYLDFNPNLSGNYIPMPLLNAPALPVNITNSVTSGLAGPSGNIWPYGWHDESLALVEKYLVQPYPIQSQTYDAQSSLTGLYGRQPGFPVCMPGRPGYPGYFPSGGFPARRGPSSDLYAFADVVEKERRGSRAVGSGTGRLSY